MADVLIRVQHRPGRESVQRLLLQLPAAEVIEDGDDPPNPWRGYLRCLTDLPAEGHVAVLQDDTVACRNLAPALELIAAAHPATPVSLFLSKNGKVKRTYNLAGLRHGKSRYVQVHPADLVHAVAVLWPVGKAREFVDWIAENPKRIRAGQISTSDDAHMTRWMQLTGQTFLCTIPSIVDHPDDVPSIVNQGREKDGKDTGRCAAYWIGDDDPLDLDWTR